MTPDALSQFVPNLLIVLAAGLAAGLACKRTGVPLLVGYLLVGALVGHGGFQLVVQEDQELEQLARAGALLLLFSVGIEFSLEELIRLSRYLVIGGSIQMGLVGVLLALLFAALGLSWPAAILAGSACALSSTILVFNALSEYGQAATQHGRRAIGILLFQDVALVPLMLLVPLLMGNGETPTAGAYGRLAAESATFVSAVLVLRFGIGRWLVPLLARLRSVELVVLFTLSVLGLTCWGAMQLALPPAVGALAAGLMLSGNRLSKQIDTIILPFRESFAVVLFVTMGALWRPLALFEEPLLLAGGLAVILLVKTAAGAVALRVTGLGWRASVGMGLGLAQLGEFSFVLTSAGVAAGVLKPDEFNHLLFVALGTLILTPLLLRAGLRWTDETAVVHEVSQIRAAAAPISRALVVGIGPIGRQIASRLETLGADVCLVDLSPINVYPFAQQRFHTVAGDARDPDVLRRADAAHCMLAVICVPDDEEANQVVRAMREVNPAAPLIVRCRYQGNISAVKKSGADAVVSEEAEASEALLRRCEEIVLRSAGTPPEASSGRPSSP